MKSPRGMGVIFLHWSLGWKIFCRYVCMYVCMYTPFKKAKDKILKVIFKCVLLMPLLSYVHMSLCPNVPCPYVSICLYIHISSLCSYMSLYIYVPLSLYPYVHMSLCTYFLRSPCPYILMSLCAYVRMSLCHYVSISPYPNLPMFLSL